MIDTGGSFEIVAYVEVCESIPGACEGVPVKGDISDHDVRFTKQACREICIFSIQPQTISATLVLRSKGLSVRSRRTLKSSRRTWLEIVARPSRVVGLTTAARRPMLVGLAGL